MHVWRRVCIGLARVPVLLCFTCWVHRAGACRSPRRRCGPEQLAQAPCPPQRPRRTAPHHTAPARPNLTSQTQAYKDLGLFHGDFEANPSYLSVSRSVLRRAGVSRKQVAKLALTAPLVLLCAAAGVLAARAVAARRRRGLPLSSALLGSSGSSALARLVSGLGGGGAGQKRKASAASLPILSSRVVPPQQPAGASNGGGIVSPGVHNRSRSGAGSASTPTSP